MIESRLEEIEREKLELLEDEVDHLRHNRHLYYKPYKAQLEFHERGRDFRERLFMALNQGGKTYAGAMEVSYHLTGQYPDWWTGKRFGGPTKWWVSGDSGETTRDNPQRLLLGEIGEWGTGSIPKNCIGRHVLARGTADLVDHIVIKHVSGKFSHLYFKFYGKGRAKWQGETLDGIWFDEEPPVDVYDEGLVRTKARKGITMVTFTPLLGMSEVVMRFWNRKEKSSLRSLTQMTLEDVAGESNSHISKSDVDEWIEQIPEHERDARIKGIPYLGSGKVFPIGEEKIRVEPFEIPKNWNRIIGLDFGWGDHPTASCSLCIDPETDTVYVYDVYSNKETGIAYHALNLRNKGNLPIAWPHDGLQKDKSSGIQIAQLYRNQGLWLLSEHAQYPDNRKNGLEASVMDIYERMRSGKFKVFSTCGPWFDEFRIYHRKDGKIQCVRDDILSAMRYAVMMIRHAQPYEDRVKTRDRYEQKTYTTTTWMAN